MHYTDLSAFYVISISVSWTDFRNLFVEQFLFSCLFEPTKPELEVSVSNWTTNQCYWPPVTYDRIQQLGDFLLLNLAITSLLFFVNESQFLKKFLAKHSIETIKDGKKLLFKI